MSQSQPRIGSNFTHFNRRSRKSEKGDQKIPEHVGECEGDWQEEDPHKAPCYPNDPQRISGGDGNDRDITGEGPFLIGFKELEVGDGEEPPVFTKVELGVDILNILRGVLEDELHCYLTDARFMPPCYDLWKMQP